MAKVRVYELAKEFGVESKTVMVKLQEMGEFVRSASSTIEAPVVRRLKEAFGPEGGPAGRSGGRSGGGSPQRRARREGRFSRVSESLESAANRRTPVRHRRGII